MITVVNINFNPFLHNRRVTRPSMFGNPFSHRPCGWGCASRANHVTHVSTREEAILCFAEYWYADEQKGLRLIALEDFPPHAVLGCVCHPKPCHADIIAGYLNWKRS